jgi:hypothetical protein
MAIHVCCRCVFQIFKLFHLDVACFHLDIAYVAAAIHVCCKCIFQMFLLFRRMLQVFYLDTAYLAVVIHICCKHMFQLFHIVLVFCNRCCTPRALTHGQAHGAPGTLAPPGLVPHSGACNRLNTCAYVLCSLPLSRIGARVLCSLALGYARCDPFLFRIRAHTLCSLSH